MISAKNRSKGREAARQVSVALKRSKRRKRVRYLVLFSIFILLIFFFVSGPRGTYRLFSFTKQKHDLKKEIETLENESEQLQLLKDKLENEPDYIEKVAREEYKMKKKDEKVYQIVEE
jgi:cell division protein FtsB